MYPKMYTFSESIKRAEKRLEIYRNRSSGRFFAM